MQKVFFRVRLVRFVHIISNDEWKVISIIISKILIISNDNDFSFKSFSFLMFPVGEIFVETTAGGGQQKKAFLKISQKNACVGVFS